MTRFRSTFDAVKIALYVEALVAVIVFGALFSLYGQPAP